ncbi:MAG: GAF domain-containing protein [Mycobacterium sp.]
MAERLIALLTPSTRPAPGVMVTVAVGLLIAETVLAILLKQVDPQAPIGILYAVLMGLALLVNFVGGVAAAGAASADRRRDAELAAELARLMLRADNLRSAAEGTARHLAVALGLRFASVELEDTAGDHRGWAIPLHDAGAILGVLEVPDDLPRATRERLLRVVPTFEALLAAARKRQDINDRLVETRRRLEQFFDLSSDLMVISDEGNLLQINPAFERTLGYTRDELTPAAFELFDLVPREDMDRLQEPIQALTDGRGPVRFENRATGRDGSLRWIEWNVAPHKGMFYAVGRDITRQRKEQEQLRQTQTMLEASRDALHALAEQQAALRRIATQVAQGASPDDVFSAVAEAIGRCLHVAGAAVSRYEDDAVVVLALAPVPPEIKDMVPMRVRFPLEGNNVATRVCLTKRPARMDSHDNATGAIADLMRELGVQSIVAVPILVADRVWGMASGGTTGDEPMPADTEERLADFADLVATAIASAAARDEVQSSRDTLRELAEHQAGLRRVATLVAQGAAAVEVFHSVNYEMARCMHATDARLARCEDDGTVTVLAARNEPGMQTVPVGSCMTLADDRILASVLSTGRAAREDCPDDTGSRTDATIHEPAIRTELGVPIIVDGRVWGAVRAGSTGPQPAPSDTEARIADFADLIATAIANTSAREQLDASRDRLRDLARHQTGLRRVAELVARESQPAEVFAAVAEEMAGCVDAYNATVARFEGDEIVIEALGRAELDLLNKPAVGEHFPLEGDHIAPIILRTGRPARMDSHEHARGATAARIREIGVRSMVGVPIVVGGHVWGVVGVASRTGPLPADTEARMADFADLVGTSIANAATRADLEASRDSLRQLAHDLSVLANQQAALRRVATLVARGVSQSEVFSAVAEEMARCLNLGGADVFRYDDDGAAIVVVASYAAPGVPHMSVGERLTTEGENLSGRVYRTGQAARTDNWEGAVGCIAERVRELGFRSCVGAPIVVDERVWGMAGATTQTDSLPPDTEARIAEFAELVATAIAAATARADLIASRARIVAAADDARRRLERDIHDGAQQRLISLGLKLRLAEESVPPECDDLKAVVSEAVSGLTDVFNELQQISRGIHPAILSTGGLAAGFKTLARRSPVPVNLDLEIERRLPDSVEVAAYYVVAEALTNAAKHAHASEVKVRAHANEESLNVLISDDGIGGADSRKGSGLVGLKDRIEVLGGRMRVASPPGGGTSIDIAIPYSESGG